MLKQLTIFEKRATNLIRMRKIAITAKIRLLDFNNKLYENSLFLILIYPMDGEHKRCLSPLQIYR